MKARASHFRIVVVVVVAVVVAAAAVQKLKQRVKQTLVLARKAGAPTKRARLCSDYLTLIWRLRVSTLSPDMAGHVAAMRFGTALQMGEPNICSIMGVSDAKCGYVLWLHGRHTNTHIMFPLAQTDLA